MRELDQKEEVIKSVQEIAEQLLFENHPARLTIEVGFAWLKNGSLRRFVSHPRLILKNTETVRGLNSMVLFSSLMRYFQEMRSKHFCWHAVYI